MWHFYTGSSITIYMIQETTRKLLELKLGDNSENGEMFQVLVKRGSWFGAMINDPSSYSLVGCTVCPAFMFEDFELANRKTLISIYPEHKAIIKKLTISSNAYLKEQVPLHRSQESFIVKLEILGKIF